MSVFDNFGATEYLLDLIPIWAMTDTTTGNDLYNRVEQCLNELDWNTFSSITNDGAPTILDVKAGSVSRQKVNALNYGFRIEEFSLHNQPRNHMLKKMKMEHVVWM